MYSRSTEGDRHLEANFGGKIYNLGLSVVLLFYLPPKLLFSFIYFKNNYFSCNL